MKKILSLLAILSSAQVAADVGSGRPLQGSMAPPRDLQTDQVQVNLESNIYDGRLYITPSLTYTTPFKFSIFVGSQNLPIYGGSSDPTNFEGDTYVGVSQFIKITDHFATIVGGQLGYPLINGPKQLHAFGFWDIRFRPVQWLVFHGGPYIVNDALSTTNSYVSFQTGAELNFDTVKVNLDYFGGHSNVSGATVKVTNKWSSAISTYFGVGVPETNSGNDFYGIIGAGYAF